MNLALTLVIQGIVFFLVAWAVMKYFWPFLMGAIEERQKKIAAGLAAASKSEKDLAEAEERSKDIIREARDRAAQIVDIAGKRSTEIVEEAKGTATVEAQRLVAQDHPGEMLGWAAVLVKPGEHGRSAEVLRGTRARLA